MTRCEYSWSTTEAARLFARVFDDAAAAGAEVIGYAENRGKGHALKVGFAHVRANYPGEHVVSADSDGQHLPSDILRIAERLRSEPHALVLGGREFSGDVPARSRSATRSAVGCFASRPDSRCETLRRDCVDSGRLCWSGSTRFRGSGSSTSWRCCCAAKTAP